jgi:hypothetical protein
MRSGSTLQYNLVQALLKSKKSSGEGFVSIYSWRKKRRQIYSWVEDDKYHVIKTHDILPFSEEYLHENREKIIFFYIYRDIRDVAVSLGRKLNQEVDSLLSLLDSQLKVFNYLTKKSREDKSEIFIQKYELLTCDILGGVSEISNFLNLSIEDFEVARIAQEWTIENVRKEKIGLITTDKVKGKSTKKFFRTLVDSIFYSHFKANKKISTSSRVDPKNLLHSDHISSERGRTNQWKEKLSRRQADIINVRYKQWLIDNGYHEA